jgi:hypothetical protein
MGDRQFRPSIVPPWTTVYWCVAPVEAVISSTCDLVASVGCVSADQGYNAPSAATTLVELGASARAVEATSRTHANAETLKIIVHLSRLGSSRD